MHVRAAIRPSTLAYRWVRQLHVWIGAWGALASLVFLTAMGLALG